MGNPSEPTCRLVRPDDTYDGKQGLTYFCGIAAETVGAQGICMHLLTIPPGGRAKAHMHASHETAIYILEGEVVLVEDDGETVMRAGDCATFAKGNRNGHHLINRSSAMARFLEIGSRSKQDECSYPDIDLHAARGGYQHKDGTPY